MSSHHTDHTDLSHHTDHPDLDQKNNVKKKDVTNNVKKKDVNKKAKRHQHAKFEDKYTLGDEEIGAGATAVVKICFDRDGVEYAVKMMDRKNVCMDEGKFNEEIKVLEKLRHPNIIRMHDVYKTKQQILVVTELASGGELFDRILDQNTFEEKDAAKITRRLFNAIQYMHGKGICHRDLKPENIMFKNTSINSPLKIVDFGFASSLFEKKKKFQTMSQLGTMGYAAPEVFTGKPYSEKCDIWSLGVIVYILLCGFPPFVDMQDETKEDIINTPFWVYVNKMQESVLGGSENPVLDFPEEHWKHVSSAAKNFLKQILVVDPAKRPSATEALKHEWLASELKKGKHLNLTMSNMRKFKTMRKAHGTMSLKQTDLTNLEDIFKMVDLNYAKMVKKQNKKSIKFNLKNGKIVSSGEGD
eukprot:CAMPEP_0197516600 /NCGR_PEP_ID=MMETSP1318-20131121/1500_1 /TAXON_ID=552666 /ORGANISM="Partenskyella glossopodia, Strain RCC365" /LENGTH=413 /DNA_ID=CAMNT_0043065469 /DNA_START=378 /DNA_END=1619 /DNA_ORIENTATION=+